MRKTAKKRIATLAARASSVLSDSCKVVEEFGPPRAAEHYRKRAGTVIGYLFADVLDPIRREFPELEPDEAKRPPAAVEPHRLSVGAVQAGQAAVHQVRQLLRDMASDVQALSEEDRVYFQAALAEVDHYLDSLERFIAAGLPQRDLGSEDLA